jgi:FMN reductase
MVPPVGSGPLVAVSAGDSPTSKTRALARAALDISGGGHLVDLLDLPAGPLLGRSHDPAVDEAVERAAGAGVLVLVTPVYRATYSGALKAFLDRFPTGALAGTAVVLGATAASPAHFLALDTGGRALVASLSGWTVPTVVYATAADFEDGTPGPGVVEVLAKALGEAQAIRSLLVGFSPSADGGGGGTP